MRKLFVFLVCVMLIGQAVAQQDSTKKDTLSMQKVIVPDFYEKVVSSVGDTNILRYYYTDTLKKLTLIDPSKEAYDHDTLKFGILIIISKYYHSVSGGSFTLGVLNYDLVFYPNDHMAFGIKCNSVCTLKKNELMYNNKWLKEAIEKITKKDFPLPTKEALRRFVIKNFEKS